MTSPMTPNEVVLHLTKLARDLDEAVRVMHAVEKDYVEKRAAADLAYSRAFMSAAGSVDARKHQASIGTHEQRLEAEVAEVMVHHLRRKIDALKVRIDVGRSYGAAVRAELNLQQAGVD